MIPTSKDCVLTAAVLVGDEADIGFLVDELGEQATLTLGGCHEIVVGERGLERLVALGAEALTRMRENRNDSHDTEPSATEEPL